VIWILVVFLVGYGNAKSLREPSAVPAEPWLGLAQAGALVLLVAAATRAGPRLSLAELGLLRAGSARAAALGLLFGVATAVPALVVLRFPPLLGEPVRYAPLADLDPAALLLRALVLMPLDTAIPEELAFRGLLFGWLRRGGRVLRAVFVSATAYAAWHLVIVSATLVETNVLADPRTAVLGTLGAFGAVFAGGVAFALLRAWTGRLAAPLAAHATFNAAILLGLGAGP
jgi:membrane protease YdiL (CAAX protease family)